MQPTFFILIGSACSLAASISPNTRTNASIAIIAAIVISLTSFVRGYGIELTGVSFVIFLSSWVVASMVFWIAAQAWNESPLIGTIRQRWADRTMPDETAPIPIVSDRRRLG